MPASLIGTLPCPQSMLVPPPKIWIGTLPPVAYDDATCRKRRTSVTRSLIARLAVLWSFGCVSCCGSAFVRLIGSTGGGQAIRCSSGRSSWSVDDVAAVGDVAGGGVTLRALGAGGSGGAW